MSLTVLAIEIDFACLDFFTASSALSASYSEVLLFQKARNSLIRAAGLSSWTL